MANATSAPAALSRLPAATAPDGTPDACTWSQVRTLSNGRQCRFVATRPLAAIAAEALPQAARLLTVDPVVARDSYRAASGRE